MDETMLTLKAGVALTERDGQVGLTLNGCTQFVKETQQAEILRALISQSQSPESLTALLQKRESAPHNNNEIFLVIAEFILDFGVYLEA